MTKVLITFGIAFDLDDENALPELLQGFEDAMRRSFAPVFEQHSVEEVDEVLDLYGPTVTFKRETLGLEQRPIA